MTWGDDYVTGIADIAKAGFHGVQLRANAMAQFGEKPEALKALLAQHKVEFVCFSSNNVALAPEREAETMALHEKNARFVAAAGGQFLQVTDERPKDRTPTSEDRKRMGGILTKLGQRTAALGVKLVYHNHMGNLGERPEEVAEVLAATDPAAVGFLLDMAHYTQAGGDVAKAVRTHRSRLAVLHAKDVRTVPRAADAKPDAPGVSVRRAGARPGRPAGRVRRARRSRLSWLGDPRARRGARPGRHGERLDAHEQALHRAGAQARPLKARFPMV